MKTIENKFNISFGTPQKTDTKKDLYMTEQYNRLLGYCEAYEKDILSQNNGMIDLNGQKINSNGVAKIKLENIEQYATNTILNRIDLIDAGMLPLKSSKQQKELLKSLSSYRVNNKQSAMKGVDNIFNGYSKINLTPLDVINHKYESGFYQQKVDDNQHLIDDFNTIIKNIGDKKLNQIAPSRRQKKLSLKRQIVENIFVLD